MQEMHILQLNWDTNPHFLLWKLGYNKSIDENAVPSFYLDNHNWRRWIEENYIQTWKRKKCNKIQDLVLTLT